METGHYEKVRSTHSSYSRRRFLQGDDTAASFDDSDEEPIGSDESEDWDADAGDDDDTTTTTSTTTDQEIPKSAEEEKAAKAAGKEETPEDAGWSDSDKDDDSKKDPK